MSYIPALDGLRALAVIAVLCVHLLPKHYPGGVLGVDVFFVLSGFLITSILLKDLAENGRIRFGHFYARRARRLLPALVGCLAMTSLIWVVLHQRPGFFKAALAAIAYYGNWVMAYDGRAMWILSHTWSLSVEEQFYIVWPVTLLLALRLCPHRSQLVGVTLGFAAGFAILRVILYCLDSRLASYTSTLARLDALFVGCACAFAFQYPSVRAFWSGRRGMIIASACGVTLFLLGFLFNRMAIDFITVAGYPIIALYAGAIILHLASGAGQMNRLLQSPALVAIGKRSYGIYLYHYPLFLPALIFPGAKLVIVALAFAIAWLSYRYLESPFLEKSPA